MNWYEWLESNYSKDYRIRMAKRDKAKENAPIAAEMAFEAGIQEGLRRATDKLRDVIMRGER